MNCWTAQHLLFEEQKELLGCLKGSRKAAKLSSSNEEALSTTVVLASDPSHTIVRIAVGVLILGTPQSSFSYPEDLP